MNNFIKKMAMLFGGICLLAFVIILETFNDILNIGAISDFGSELYLSNIVNIDLEEHDKKVYIAAESFYVYKEKIPLVKIKDSTPIYEIYTGHPFYVEGEIREGAVKWVAIRLFDSMREIKGYIISSDEKNIIRMQENKGLTWLYSDSLRKAIQNEDFYNKKDENYQNTGDGTKNFFYHRYKTAVSSYVDLKKIPKDDVVNIQIMENNNIKPVIIDESGNYFFPINDIESRKSELIRQFYLGGISILQANCGFLTDQNLSEYLSSNGVRISPKNIGITYQDGDECSNFDGVKFSAPKEIVKIENKDQLLDLLGIDASDVADGQWSIDDIVNEAESSVEMEEYGLSEEKIRGFFKPTSTVNVKNLQLDEGKSRSAVGGMNDEIDDLYENRSPMKLSN
jgi:hypothetical protein